MNAVIIIAALFAIGVGVALYKAKKAGLKDSDGDFIPDVVEDKIEEAKETLKKATETVKRVKEEVSDVVETAKELTAQVKDVAEVAKGNSKSRKGRKPVAKK